MPEMQYALAPFVLQCYSLKLGNKLCRRRSIDELIDYVIDMDYTGFFSEESSSNGDTAFTKLFKAANTVFL